MISTARFWWLATLTLVVYGIGMFVTLFENDSAQFAVMAMRMVQENDFINLFKGPQEYLDKPHMHYWLAALSFKIFGIHDWAYRIPGILATMLAAFSCYGLGKLLYNTNVGRLAALIFMTAQTIVLSAIDVRTDAVLTGFTIFSIWHLVAYIERNSLKNILWGAFGAGVAFSTKGQIALLVIGLCIFCHMVYTRKWKQFLNWRVVAALVVFALTISPMLYAYYHQFDLHPEKVIRGKDHRSGIFFIFWEQSFERMSGEGMGKNSSDYFFFFHTFLWVFLPWTVLALIAYWERVKIFVQNQFRYKPDYEFLTLGGIALIFFIISFAQFKLPHYMNIMMPLFAVLTASFVHTLYRHPMVKRTKILLGIQYFILGLVCVFALVVGFYIFEFKYAYLYVLVVVLVISVIYLVFRKTEYTKKLITISVSTALLLNLVLNAHFYPNLLNYQGGSKMAEKVKELQIPVDRIYKFTERYTWALDFYNQHPVTIIAKCELEQMKDVWVYVDDNELQQLKSSGLQWNKQLTVDQFRITRLQLKFLNPKTRAEKLNKMHLVHLP